MYSLTIKLTDQQLSVLDRIRGGRTRRAAIIGLLTVELGETVETQPAVIAKPSKIEKIVKKVPGVEVAGRVYGNFKGISK